PRPHRSTLFPYTTLFRSFPVLAAALVGCSAGPGAKSGIQRSPSSVAGRKKLINSAGLSRMEKTDGIPIELVPGRLFARCEPSNRSEEHTSELQSLAYLVC